MKYLLNTLFLLFSLSVSAQSCGWHISGIRTDWYGGMCCNKGTIIQLQVNYDTVASDQLELLTVRLDGADQTSMAKVETSGNFLKITLNFAEILPLKAFSGRSGEIQQPDIQLTVKLKNGLPITLSPDKIAYEMLAYP